ncbi:MAG: hypothetical protein IKJ69_02735 [Clostridia bacterium]|nr:hypothetical protein [Clostridia bacterium]
MKKLISLLLVVIISTMFFACNKIDGDLGKQTTVDKENGYTLIEEVKPFKFNDEEDALEDMKGVKLDGFKVTKDNTTGAIKTKADVIDIAVQEATEDYNTITIYFDRTRGIWKVVFSIMTETTAKDGAISRENEVKETVYVDEDGYTLFSFKQ